MNKIMGILFAFALFIGCASSPRPTPQQIAEADYGDPPSKYQDSIKGVISPKLFDPYSAIYTFSVPDKGWNNMLGKTIYGYSVCGSINAKNRFGGYVGAKPFYSFFRNESLVVFIHDRFVLPDSFALGMMAGAKLYSPDILCR